MKYHLAQVTVARMRGTLDAPVMAVLAARIDEMNQLAEGSVGFIWRLRGSDASLEALRPFQSYFTPFEPERLFFNLSVWDGVEHLRRFVYDSKHAEMLKGREAWLTQSDRPGLALWWIDSVRLPTVADSAERLAWLRERGPTERAFTFDVPFARPARAGGSE